ncbi:MAG TPA: serine/threonine-protein kinase [Thermomicrobiales bacterium]|nr:serine/threonine-protein kinase [Thermomicrobiales bacterium]
MNAGVHSQPDVSEETDGPPPLPPGAIIAPGYRIVGFLRRGRDLDVYDLWSESRSCRCVGKTVRPDRLEKCDARARLLREGKLLLRLTHPHIVRVYEVQTTPAPLVILETLPGETLSHLIDRRKRRLGLKEVAHLGIHLCSAIGYLHRNDILHLDLKPSNIIATHGMAKVLDLSLARRPGPSRSGIGTTGYMAPEQSLGGEFGAYTDVWGIGVTLYEVATGEPACDAGDETSTTWVQAEPCHVKPVRHLRRLPVSLAWPIDHCLSFDPASRPTVDELTSRLGMIVSEAPAIATEHST